MNKLIYVYDPHRNLLAVFEGTKPIGGYIGQIAERKLEKLLNSDEEIHIGQFLTRNEINKHNLKTRPL